MNARASELARRRERLVAQLAAHRAEFGRQLRPWFGLMAAFGEVRSAAGLYVRRHLAVITVVTGLVAVLFSARVLRPDPLIRLWSALRFVQTVGRWWMRWKLTVERRPSVIRVADDSTVYK